MILYLFGMLFFGCEPTKSSADDFDIDNDGVVAVDDCDDTNPNIYPHADELCDGVDNDCDDLIDEDDAVGAVNWYADLDGDNFGDPNSFITSCQQPEGYVVDDTDCLDSNATVFPGSDEYCDEIDNDCDGAIDEDSALDSQLFYRDIDGDGYGNPYIFEHSCFAEDGYVNNNDDCNDSDGMISPAAVEICDEQDNDCDEYIDDQDDSLSDPFSWYIDFDGDGYGSGEATESCIPPLPSYVTNGDDCNDGTSMISPAAVEWCGDELDNDCDGAIDLDDPDANAVSWFADLDGDEFGDPESFLSISCEAVAGGVPNSLDCDDTNGDISPVAVEIWYDGVDQDCAGDDDNDADADGVAGLAGGGEDCNDSDPEVLPGIPDICGDGVDNNCDDVGDLCEQNQMVSSPTPGIQMGMSIVSLVEPTAGSEMIFVGAPGSDENIQGGGSAYLYTDFEQDATLRIHGHLQGLHAGSLVAVGGDLSADGQIDLLIGAYGADFGGLDSGSVYLLSQDNSGDISLGDIPVRIDGQGTGNYLGRSMVSNLDMDGDQQVDLLLGAPFAALNGGDSGAVYLMQGPVEGVQSVSEATITFVGGESGEQAGYAIEAEDLNGDGLMDYMIGAPVNSTGNYAGMLYVVYGPVDPFVLLSTADGRWTGDWANGRLGSTVSSGADFNNDGFVDVVVGAPERDGGHGAAYILAGPANSVAVVDDAWARVEGEDLGARLGASLVIDDLDNDGEPDVVIGAPENDQQEILGGAAFVLFGGIAEGNQVPDAVFYGEEIGGLLGFSMASGANGVWLGAPGVDQFGGALFLLGGIE